jgi:hypothetical protein
VPPIADAARSCSAKQFKRAAILADLCIQRESTMPHPVKGVINPPQSETQTVEPKPPAKKPAEKPATPPPQHDTVKISPTGEAANADDSSKKTQQV